MLSKTKVREDKKEAHGSHRQKSVVTPLDRSSKAPLRLMLAATVMLLAALAGTALARPPQKNQPAKNQPARIAVGDPAPACTLQGLDGSTISTPQDSKGRAVIYHFWSSLCKSCKEEMPVMETLYKQYKGKDLVIYAVHVKQPARAAKAFADRAGITFPIVTDADGALARQFGVVGVPRTYFVDRKGTIKSKLLGDGSRDTLEKFILEIL